MEHFFWLQDICVRLSAIKLISKVKPDSNGGGGFSISDTVGYNDNAVYIHYTHMDEAVAVHSKLIEAMENERNG